jgi:hypothetical protein
VLSVWHGRREMLYIYKNIWGEVKEKMELTFRSAFFMPEELSGFMLDLGNSITVAHKRLVSVSLGAFYCTPSTSPSGGQQSKNGFHGLWL